MHLEVFKGQIRVNEKKTYFGLDYELTDEVGNLIDKYNQLEKEKQKLIDYLKEELKNLEINRMDFSSDYYIDRKFFLKEILSKIEKSDN